LNQRLNAVWTNVEINAVKFRRAGHARLRRSQIAQNPDYNAFFDRRIILLWACWRCLPGQF
jgi:hypothetical protein